MTRKRSGKTLVHQLTDVCPTCRSVGFVKSVSTAAFEVLGDFKTMVLKQPKADHIGLRVSPEVFDYLIHAEYYALISLEKEIGARIVLESDKGFEDKQFRIERVEK